MLEISGLKIRNKNVVGILFARGCLGRHFALSLINS